MSSLSRHKIESNCILFAEGGSRAYGLETEDSDKDYVGITIAPPSYYLGLSTFEIKDKGWHLEPGVFEENNDPAVDTKIYELRHFLRLVERQNPNILEILWTPEEHLIKSTRIGRDLIYRRSTLLTKKVAHTFTRYAESEMKRCLSGEGKGGKRKERIEKYGYDTKGASHALRLLFMAYEALKYGTLTVNRQTAGDALILRSIKQGEIRMDACTYLVQQWLDMVKGAQVDSKLEEKLTREEVNELCMSLVRSHFIYHYYLLT